MDIIKMLSELRAEREQIEEAIVVLERLAQGHGKRRGRPPAWMSATKSKHPLPTNDGTPKKRMVSPEARTRMAQAQRKRWATVHAAAQKS
jgi:hypothetical protein